MQDNLETLNIEEVTQQANKILEILNNSSMENIFLITSQVNMKLLSSIKDKHLRKVYSELYKATLDKTIEILDK